MAWGSGANVGSANSKTSSGTIAATLSAGLSVGDVIFVGIASDQLGSDTVDGDTTLISGVADTKSNTYTKIREYTNGDAAGADGVTVSLWYSQLTVALTTSDTVTGTLSGNRTAKSIGLGSATVTSGSTVSVQTTAINVLDGTTAPTATISGQPSQEYISVAALAVEGPADTFTQDSDYTSYNTPGTTGGADASNMRLRFSRRILTATGDTYDPTLGTARDTALVLAFVKEVSGATTVTISTPGAITLTGQTVNLVQIQAVGIGSMTLAGQTVNLLQSQAITPGAITLTGQTVLLTNIVQIGTPGAIVLAGQTVNTGGVTTVTVTPGAVTLTGQTVNLKQTQAIGIGSVTLAGQTVNVLTTAPVSPGALALAGQTIALKQVQALTPGSITLTGQSITVSAGGGAAAMVHIIAKRGIHAPTIARRGVYE